MSAGDDYQIVTDTVKNGVRHVTATPSSLVCSKLINFDLIDGKIYNLKYMRGCHGNLQGIGILVEGMSVDEIHDKLTGVRCGDKGTSCPDQLSRAVKKAYEASKKG